jgi:predicted nucleic acid-binding protein
MFNRGSNKMRVYLDVCCFNRPFDDQSQEKVHLEAEAVIGILKRCENRAWGLVGSDIIKLEIMKSQDNFKKQKVLLLYEVITEEIKYNNQIKTRAAQLRENGVKMIDSLHLAFAEYADVDAFLTTDIRLLKSAVRSDIKIRIENPVNYYMEVLYSEQFGG